MHFLLIARDGRDADAPARRAQTRDAHLVSMQKLKDESRIIAASRVIDDAGTVVGATLYLEFDNRSDFDAWLVTEPYVREKVWQTTEVISVQVTYPPQPRT